MLGIADIKALCSFRIKSCILTQGNSHRVRSTPTSTPSRILLSQAELSPVNPARLKTPISQLLTSRPPSITFISTLVHQAQPTVELALNLQQTSQIALALPISALISNTPVLPAQQSQVSANQQAWPWQLRLRTCKTTTTNNSTAITHQAEKPANCSHQESRIRQLLKKAKANHWETSKKRDQACLRNQIRCTSQDWWLRTFTRGNTITRVSNHLRICSKKSSYSGLKMKS